MAAVDYSSAALPPVKEHAQETLAHCSRLYLKVAHKRDAWMETDAADYSLAAQLQAQEHAQEH